MIGEGVEGRGRGLNFREGRKKEHEKPIFLCPAPPEYQVGVLTTRSRHSEVVIIQQNVLNKRRLYTVHEFAKPQTAREFVCGSFLFFVACSLIFSA